MTMPGDEIYHAALASGTRRRVLEVLTGSPVPLEAQPIAERLGLHVTTVRFHLDQLEQAGLVRRERAEHRRRGRPSLLYSAAGPVSDESVREQLIGVLAGALSAKGDAGRIRSVEAGRRWADGLGGRHGDGRAVIIDRLERLGFDPEPDGDTILLHACPFRSAAMAHSEIVCSVHQGMLEGLLGNSDGGDALDVDLVPFVGPESCLVALLPRSPRL